uniref:Histone-lysine N-methyltransferase SETD1B-A-like n=1 Tax=Sinocyclocheilus anshuiensis TaxID=1608454 RepID=A0A671KVT3_9TELE
IGHKMSRPGERNKLNEDHGRRQSSSLANGMENSHPICSSGERRSHWRSYKLIIDPALKKGSHKVYRYDGQNFSVPNPGMPPVDIVRDPRIGRLWTKYKETDLPVPKFKIDECYIGRVPPKEVTFAKLNDNVREGFLTDMCKKFGEIEEVEILYNPKNKKHLGIAKVVFGTVKAAKDAVQNLNNTSVMGNIIHVELDPKGENRLRYFQRLINGSYTPLTLPVGGEEACEVSPRSLAEALLVKTKPDYAITFGGTATPGGTNTPMSLDTAYSSLRQDTPQSQGTPHTPRPSGTPFSQDSSYSSRQGTPAFQSNRAESSGGYKSRRHETKFQDAYNRRPERHYVHGTGGGVHRGNAEQPASFKQHQPPEPPSPAFAHTPPPPANANFKNAFSPYQPPIPPLYPHTEPSFHQPVQREVDYRRPPQAPPPPSTEFMPVIDRPATPPIPEPPPPAPETQPATPPPSTPELCPSLGTPTQDSERNSLDSRIEMLLKPFLTERGDSDAEVRMDGSPISSSSSQLSPIPPQRSSRPSSTGLEDISPTPLPDSDDDEPILGTASQLANSRAMSPSMHNKSGAGEPRTPIDKMDTGHQSSGEDMEISDDEMPGTPIASGDCESIVVNSAMSPMQTIPMHPPGFPPLPPPQAGFPLPPPPLPTVPHLAGPPGVAPHPMLHALHPYPPGLMPIMQMDLMSSLPQWGSIHMSFQMQTQMLSRMAQSQRPYPYPHFISGAAASAAAMQFGGPYPPLSMVGAPASTVGQGQPWHLPNMPKFNPAVPPPGYEPQKEDPHKATVDAVLMLIVKELKSIMKRDLNRKMVEVVAFRAFDEWWDKQERSAKATLTPVKTGEGKDDEKERAKPKETISSSLLENWNKVEGLGFEGIGLSIGLRSAIRLPSFKVKRKQPPEPTSTNDNKRVRPSTPVDDELEDEGVLTFTISPPESSSLSSSSKSDSDSSGSESLSDYESSSGEEEEEEEEQVEGMEDEDEADAQISSSSSSSTSSSSEEEDVDVKAPPTGPPPEEEPNELGRLEALDEAEIDHKHTVVSSIKPGVENVWPPSPKGLPGQSLDSDEPDIDLAVSIPVSKAEATLEDVGSLRPPTLTGSFADSDQDTRPKIPAEDFPQTPGRDGPVSLESEAAIPRSLPTPSMHLPFPPNHALEARSLLPPPEALPDMPVRGRLPTEEDIPRTPGRDLMDRPRGLGKSQSTDAFPVTPGSDTPLTGNSLSSPHIPGSPFSYPAQSPVLSAGIPRTPGRDLTFTPAFPDSAALSAGLPIHRKVSSESLEEKSLFKEPLLSASPHASLPNNAVSSPFPGPPLPAASLQEPPLPPQGSSPTSVETSSSAAPKDLPVPMIDVPVPLDATPSKRKQWRPKSKKVPVATPPDSEEPPAPMVDSLPPDLPVNDLYPDHPSETFKGEDGDSTVLEEEENQTQTVIPEVEDRLLYVEEPIQKTRRQRRGWQELLLSMHSPVISSPRPSFLPRSEFEEMTILYDIWNDGIDEEDICYLKITYDKMLQQDNGNDWLNDTLWVHHPHILYFYNKKRKEDGIRDHVTGCARSEGYYKIDKKDKMKYLNSSRLQSEEPDVDTQGKSIPAQPQASTRAGSERRSEQRRLLSSFSCDSDLLKFNQLKFRKKKIRFCKSHIHDWGLFAMEPIAADEMVIEYVGQNIRQVIADMREKRYEEKGIGSSYMFRVDHDAIIDATKCGNFARFINHSCNPNCYAKVITVESQKKIVIYSRQPINVNEEITYDYKFPIEDEKIPCLCGAENCRGTLN